MKILLVDHEDSFVYNLYQALRGLRAEVRCLRYTASTSEAMRWDPDAVVLSPGPGHPSDPTVTRLARSLLARLAPERPTLGVCLGHQLIGEFYGGRVIRAASPVHGETASICHTGTGLFHGVPSPFRAARYHSLVLAARRLPPVLELTARTPEGTVMAVRHRRFPVSGVQFHPESYLTEHGGRVLENFLSEVRR